MDVEILKKELKVNLQGILNTLDPEFDLSKALDKYFKVLNFDLEIAQIDDLEGLKNNKLKALYNIFVNKDFSDDSVTFVGVFNHKFEAFVKKIYFILDQFGEIPNEIRLDLNKAHALNPFMSALNKVNIYYSDNQGKPTLNKDDAKKDIHGNLILNKNQGQNQYKRLYLSSLDLNEFEHPDDPKLSSKHNNSFIYHFLRAYLLRNKHAHSAPVFTMMQSLNNIQSTFITELWITHFFIDKLKLNLPVIDNDIIDFTKYAENEIERLKDQNSRFVPLSLRLYSNQHNIDQLTIENIATFHNIRFRLLGEGGSGKTTSLEQIVYQKCVDWLNNKSLKIPVLIFLSNLNEADSLKNVVSLKISQDIITTEELIRQNKIILLLDGLNEIVNDRIKQKKKLEIKNIIEENKDLEILISDRYSFDSFQDDPFDIPTYGIEKLNKNQISQFVEKYCADSKHYYKDLLQIINSKPNIQSLLTKPLILSRAIEIIKLNNELPEKEGQIIGAFMDLMLRREKDEKMDPLLNIFEFKLLMGFLSNVIYVEFKSNTPIVRNKCLKIMNEGSNQLGLEKFNATYSLRIGFELNILSYKDDLIQFYHQSYFEYFVDYYTQYELS